MVGIHWNTSLFFGWPIFRGYANFREGTVMFPLKALNICFLRINSRFDCTARLTLFAAKPFHLSSFVLLFPSISSDDLFLIWIFLQQLPSSNFSSRGTKIFKSEDQILSKEPGIFWGIAKHHYSVRKPYKSHFLWGGGLGFCLDKWLNSKVRGGSQVTEILGISPKGL